MITAGVDLATQPAKTGLAVIEWQAGRARLAALKLGVTDRDIADVAGQVDKLGIDCPFGWPDGFIDFITIHATGGVNHDDAETGDALRRRLAYRETDRAMHRAGFSPLSVAADRIGLTAIRAALVLDLIGRSAPVDRSGSGVVVEVYPAASLGRWGLPNRRYKRDGNRSAREELVTELMRAAPWLDLNGHDRLCQESDDAFDALIAALTARAAALGRCVPPPESLLPQARREGWIALPYAEISRLLDDPRLGAERCERR